MTEYLVKPARFKEAFLVSVERTRNGGNPRVVGRDGKAVRAGDPRGAERFRVHRTLGTLADELGFDYRRSYLGMGAVFLVRDEGGGAGLPGAGSIVVVAIEHEDAIMYSPAKMKKLVAWNAPLKVLITYPPEGTAKGYLRHYAHIIGLQDLFKDFSFLRRHLLVFGTRPGNGAPSSWQFFHYLLGEFRPL